MQVVALAIGEGLASLEPDAGDAIVVGVAAGLEVAGKGGGFDLVIHRFAVAAGIAAAVAGAAIAAPTVAGAGIAAAASAVGRAASAVV